MTMTSVIYELVGVDRASPAFRSAGNSAASAESKLSSLGKTASKIGLAVAGMGAAVAAESVRMAVTFQTSMERIKTQAGGTQADVDSLTKSVLKLAPATQQGPQQLADALYHLKSLGMDNASAMKALATSSNLAAVGGANLEDTATAIGAAWRSGIKGGKDFYNVAATVNAIIGAGNMKMSDFVDALSSGILPAARTFGVSLKSVGAAMALMTDEGVPAQLAATRLRMSLSLLGAPSAQASKYLAQIGLTGTQLANAMRSPGGLVAAVSLLKQHLDDSGLSASQAAQLISRAFSGGQSSSAIMTMLNNLDTLRKKQDQINKSVGNYGGDVAAQRKTAQAQFDLLKSSLDTLGIKLGLALLPPITKFTGFLNSTAVPLISKVIKWLSSPDVKPWAELAGKLAAGATAANLIYTGLKKAAALTGLDKLLSAAKSAGTTTAAENMSTAAKMQLDASLNMLKAAGVQADAAGASTAAGAETAAGGAAASSGLLGGILAKLGLSAGITTPVGWGLAVGALIRAGGDTLAPAGTAAGKLSSAIQGSGFGGPVATGTGGYLGWAAASGWAKDLFGGQTTGGKGSGPSGFAFPQSAPSAGWLAGAWDTTYQHFQRDFAGKVTAWFTQSLPHAFLAVIPGWWSAGYEGFQRDFAGPLTSWFSVTLPNFFTADVPAWAKTLVKGGENLITGLLNGAKHEWDVAASWLGGTGSRAEAKLAGAAGWLVSKGRNAISGLLSGAEGAWGSVSRWLGGTGSRVEAKLSGAAGWLVAEGRSVISGFWSGLKDEWNKVTGWLSGLGGIIKNLKGPLSEDLKLLQPEGHAIIAGLHAGMQARWAGTQAWLSGLGGRAASLTGVSGSGAYLAHSGSGGPAAAAGSGSGDVHIEAINVNHVPGYSTPSDVKNAIAVTSRQLRLTRRR